GVGRIAQAVGGGGRRHELGDAERARRGPRERVEVRLLVELRGEQRRGDAPALRGQRDRRGEPRRDEAWQRAASVAVAAGRVPDRGAACVQGESPVLGRSFTYKA